VESFAAVLVLSRTTYASAIPATAAWTAACCALAACTPCYMAATLLLPTSMARIQPVPLSYARHVTQAGAHAARDLRKSVADALLQL
jgi:hypothetical protein